jgi:rhodanese-related sulfurtransferase
MGVEPRTIDELLAEARSGLDRVPAEELAAAQKAGALVVDIRPAEQRARDGELTGAIIVDRNVLEWRLDPSSPDRISEVTNHSRWIIVVCNEGYSSSLAAATLHRLGLHRATDLIGGYQQWLKSTTSAPHTSKPDQPPL